VDNASTECDPDIFLKEFPSILLIKNGVNTGFAKGNNAGIEKATGDIILLLNSDTILQEDSISKSADYLLHTRAPGAWLPDDLSRWKSSVFSPRFRSISWNC
jgi:GT2 family glycosyltransferase